jgi:hypothetical protein
VNTTAAEKIMIDLLVSCEDQTAGAIEEALKDVALLNTGQIEAVGRMKFWSKAPPRLIVDVLETRSSPLAGAVLGVVQGRENELDLLRSKPLDWWLDWAEECATAEETSWCCYMLGGVLAKGSERTHRELLDRFNRGASRDFTRIGRLVLSNWVGVSTDELSGQAIAALLAEGHSERWVARLLGQACTEAFAESVLLPLADDRPDWEDNAATVRVPDGVPRREPTESDLPPAEPSSSGPATKNTAWVREALALAGLRHNRRYLVKD